MSRRSLRTDTIIFGISTLCEKLLVFLVLPILAKRLPVDLYGVWTQIVATSGLISSVALLGLNTATVRILGGWPDDGKNCSSIFNQILLLVCCTSSLVALICTWFAPAISKLMFGSPDYHEFATLFGILVCTEAIYIQLLTLFESRRELVRFSLLNMLRNAGRYSVLAAGILFVGVGLQATLKWLAWFQIAMIAVVYLRFILPTAGIVFQPRHAPLKRIWQFALPLAATGILMWLGSAINRYFLLHFLSLKDVGIYSLSFTLGSITGVCWAVLSGTIYPHLTSAWQSQDRHRAAEIISRALDYYAFFALPCIAVMAFLDRPIVRTVSTQEFLVGSPLLGLISTGVALFGVYQLNVYGILLAEKSSQVFGVASAWAAGSMLLNIALIPALGLIGAPLAALVANLGLAFACVRQCRLILPYRMQWSSIGKSALSTAGMCCVLGLGIHWFPAENLVRLLLLLGLGGVVYASLDLLRKDSVLVRLGFPL